MLLKLATRNIRRSVRDYAIYFVTLVFGVAVFYAFNSIGSQQILFDIEDANTSNVFEMTQAMLGLFSAVIAFVLGFLIVYANRFLIKRRKHEFGIYLTLGMSSSDVSRIVLYETVSVGVVSLIIGLACGIALSQALSFFTASLFNLTMSHYQFVFSSAAFFTTLGCFCAIYVVVALLNLLSVRRYKLIDLLRANAKNEKLSVRNPWVCLAVFIVSIGILAAAYWQLAENGLVEFDNQFWLATALMLVGTLALFWSLAGFVIAVITRIRGVYLRGLAMFTTRQIASKVNTAFVSLWIISVMLFLSITTFSSGMGLIEVFTGNIEKAAPYDATIRADIYYSEAIDSVRPDSYEIDQRAKEMAETYPAIYADATAFDWSIEEKMRSLVPEWNNIVKSSAQIDYWESVGTTYGTLLEHIDTSTVLSAAISIESLSASNLELASLSQFNGLLEMCGKEPLDLGENECVLANNMDVLDDLAREIVQTTDSVTIGEHELALRSEVNDLQVSNSSLTATALLFVVPDAVIDELRAQGAIPIMSYLNLAYVTPGADSDKALDDALVRALPVDPNEPFEPGYSWTGDGFMHSLWPLTSIFTHEEMASQASGLRMMITYLALYIGFVFLVATAAILAIQQLSEAADSQPRYAMLSHLGCDARMLNRSLFIQVLVYFLAPLAVAVCHSACAISVLSENLFETLGTPVQGAILMAAGFTILIYGGYLLITYFASRTIVKQVI